MLKQSEEDYRQYSKWLYEDLNDTSIRFLEILLESDSIEELELKLVIQGYLK